MLQYRSTPKGEFNSPSELLMSRRLRSNFPIKEDLLTPKLVALEKHKALAEEKMSKVAKNHNRGKREHSEIHPGDEVMFKVNSKGKFGPGKVIEKLP